MIDRELTSQENVGLSKTPASHLNVQGEVEIFANISMSGTKGPE
jgi:hypothetical protein